jgi:hypothetical protein
LAGRGQPKSEGGDGRRERRTRDVQKFATTGEIKTDDEDLIAAIFLFNHSGWKPDDLGFPAGDFILIDLMRELDRQVSAVRKSRSERD